MLSMRLLSRSNLPPYVATVQRLHTSTLLQDSSSSSSGSDKKDKTKKLTSKPVQTEEEKLALQQQTTNRLNNLLEEMMKKPKTSKTLDLSMPSKKPKLAPKPTKMPYQESLITAAKEVATTLGGDVQKTESDLLDKLLSTEKNKSDTQVSNKPQHSLSELIADMKIDRTPEKTPMPSRTMQRSFRARDVAQKFESMKIDKFERRNPKPSKLKGQAERGDLYNGRLLNVFVNSEKANQSTDIPKLTTWEVLEKKEFNLALTHPAENIFQEMIQWTKEGKLWKFPIDNEQGMEEEHSVHFSEHVFMERHLKDWCPKRGPIRHFMELVCVGLSKNPYMTVNEKKEHIAWYREYFGSKQQLLQEVGAIEGQIPLEAKQIEA